MPVTTAVGCGASVGDEPADGGDAYPREGADTSTVDTFPREGTDTSAPDTFPREGADTGVLGHVPAREARVRARLLVGGPIAERYRLLPPWERHIMRS